MNLINVRDIEKLSQEDLGLLIAFFREKDSLRIEANSLENEENIKEILKKSAKFFMFNNIKLYEKQRNGLHVFVELINNLTLFEYCSRIWEDYYELLVEQKSSRYNVFESQYLLQWKAKKEHNLIINQFVIEEEKDYYGKNLNLALEIGALKLGDFSNSIEKYNFLMNDSEYKLKLDKPNIEYDFDNIVLKYPDDNFENHVDFLESGIIGKHEKLFNEFLENNAYKILKAKLWYDLIMDIKNYEEPISNLRAEDITLNRQVMGILSLLKELKVSQIDNTKIADFIQFLTKRDLNYSKIKDSEIYKKLQVQKISTKDKKILNREFEKIGLKFKI